MSTRNFKLPQNKTHFKVLRIISGRMFRFMDNHHMPSTDTATIYIQKRNETIPLKLVMYNGRKQIVFNTGELLC